MTQQVINILGSEWTVVRINRGEEKRLEYKDGFCDLSVKQIYINWYQKDESDLDQQMNVDVHNRTVLRHEIVHAFLLESGLGDNWKHDTFGHDETIVDWIAMQGPKLYKAWKEAGQYDQYLSST